MWLFHGFHTIFSFPTCYYLISWWLVYVPIFGNAQCSMKITLADMYIYIWQVCHDLKFSSAPRFIVFSCVPSYSICLTQFYVYFIQANKLLIPRVIQQNVGMNINMSKSCNITKIYQNSGQTYCWEVTVWLLVWHVQTDAWLSSQ